MAAIEAARTKGETPDFTQARKEVARIVNTFLLPNYIKERVTEISAVIEILTTQQNALKRKLKALETK